MTETDNAPTETTAMCPHARPYGQMCPHCAGTNDAAGIGIDSATEVTVTTTPQPIPDPNVQAQVATINELNNPNSPYKRAIAKAKHPEKETRPILLWPDPLLKKVSEPLTPDNVKTAGFTSISHLIEVLFNTMYAAKGAGLAAAQIGVNLNIFVIDLGQENPGDDHKPLVFINPSVAESKERQVFKEGCLSVPGHLGDVERAASVQVHYQDEHGAQHSMEANGILADAIQHENDHLLGLTYPERLSYLKRDIIQRSMNKLRKKAKRNEEHIKKLRESLASLAGE